MIIQFTFFLHRVVTDCLVIPRTYQFDLAHHPVFPHTNALFFWLADSEAWYPTMRLWFRAGTWHLPLRDGSISHLLLHSVFLKGSSRVMHCGVKAQAKYKGARNEDICCAKKREGRSLEDTLQTATLGFKFIKNNHVTSAVHVLTDNTRQPLITREVNTRTLPWVRPTLG